MLTNNNSKLSRYKNNVLGIWDCWRTEMLLPLQVFTTLALVGMLILPLNSFPWVLNGTLEAKVSLDRIQHFLTLSNLDLNAYYSPGIVQVGFSQSYSVTPIFFAMLTVHSNSDQSPIPWPIVWCCQHNAWQLFRVVIAGGYQVLSNCCNEHFTFLPNN